MSNKLDVDDLINWLNQSEDEAKATVAESGVTTDPFYDGVLSAIFQIREYIKRTTWKIHRCFASTKKNMDLASGKTYMIQ